MAKIIFKQINYEIMTFLIKIKFIYIKNSIKMLYQNSIFWTQHWTENKEYSTINTNLIEINSNQKKQK